VIPANVQVNVTRNDGAKANDAVNTLMEHLAIAIGTVVLLLVFFLGWRAALGRHHHYSADSVHHAGGRFDRGAEHQPHHPLFADTVARCWSTIPSS
jgi:hypothetical protein